MMNNPTNVTYMEDYLPHLVLPNVRGVTYVVPVRLLEDIAEGKKSIKVLEEWERLIPYIISEWLGSVY